MRYAAAQDSLGLEAFLALPPATVEQRRRLAALEIETADRASRPDLSLQALVNAAGLAPDDPEPWLSQARLWRWLGDYLRTRACLDAAADALRAWDAGSPLGRRRGDEYRRGATLEAALLRAWLHYDRGEWREALPWVRAAQRVQGGSTAALRIRGLLEATLGRRGKAEEIARDLARKDEFATHVAWIMSRSETALGRHRGAYNYFYDLRPDKAHAAECYRDMGRAAEQVGDWSTATRWYAESLAALPFAAKDCLRRVDHAGHGDASGRYELPIWLAFERYYVTGSLSAYLSYCFERFNAAETPADRELWGGLTVNAAGVCVRMDMERSHARWLRGLVFASTERNSRALDDLRSALRGFGPHSPNAAPLEAEIGHVLLLLEDHVTAIGHLERSLAGAPEVARTWTDLGLAQVMAGDTQAASEAFGRALQLDPDLTEAWYNRGLMHLHAGDLDRAETDLARAAALAPDNTEIAGLLQQVVQKKRQKSAR